MALDKKTYLVREHVGMFKLHEAFDILDPDTGDLLALAYEEASMARKLLKLFVNKRMLPFKVHLTDTEDKTILTIQRGFTFLRSRVRVLDSQGRLVGSFQQRLLSIGGRFDLFDEKNEKIAELKGNLIGWNFQFLDLHGKLLGRVTKKWAGMGKELFTSADNYVVALETDTDPKTIGPLLLCAALCVDMVLKEDN
ncbi:MAG TPA: hypothetical protein ENK02_14460 [Planctomycetes bacterium]|nr:hypothetical protein [Planctomycetota bacterium]